MARIIFSKVWLGTFFNTPNQEWNTNTNTIIEQILIQSKNTSFWYSISARIIFSSVCTFEHLKTHRGEKSSNCNQCDWQTNQAVYLLLLILILNIGQNYLLIRLHILTFKNVQWRKVKQMKTIWLAYQLCWISPPPHSDSQFRPELSSNQLTLRIKNEIYPAIFM